jgi:hypothetical protein
LRFQRYRREIRAIEKTLTRSQAKLLATGLGVFFACHVEFQGAPAFFQPLKNQTNASLHLRTNQMLHLPTENYLWGDGVIGVGFAERRRGSVSCP